jgi:hypothetical protein
MKNGSLMAAIFLWINLVLPNWHAIVFFQKNAQKSGLLFIINSVAFGRLVIFFASIL